MNLFKTHFLFALFLALAHSPRSGWGRTLESPSALAQFALENFPECPSAFQGVSLESLRQTEALLASHPNSKLGFEHSRLHQAVIPVYPAMGAYWSTRTPTPGIAPLDVKLTHVYDTYYLHDRIQRAIILRLLAIATIDLKLQTRPFSRDGAHSNELCRHHAFPRSSVICSQLVKCQSSNAELDKEILDFKTKYKEYREIQREIRELSSHRASLHFGSDEYKKNSLKSISLGEKLTVLKNFHPAIGEWETEAYFSLELAKLGMGYGPEENFYKGAEKLDSLIDSSTHARGALVAGYSTIRKRLFNEVRELEKIVETGIPTQLFRRIEVLTTHQDFAAQKSEMDLAKGLDGAKCRFQKKVGAIKKTEFIFDISIFVATAALSFGSSLAPSLALLVAKAAAMGVLVGRSAGQAIHACQNEQTQIVRFLSDEQNSRFSCPNSQSPLRAQLEKNYVDCLTGIALAAVDAAGSGAALKLASKSGLKSLRSVDALKAGLTNEMAENATRQAVSDTILKQAKYQASPSTGLGGKIAKLTERPASALRRSKLATATTPARVAVAGVAKFPIDLVNTAFENYLRVLYFRTPRVNLFRKIKVSESSLKAISDALQAVEEKSAGATAELTQALASATKEAMSELPRNLVSANTAFNAAAHQTFLLLWKENIREAARVLKKHTRGDSRLVSPSSLVLNPPTDYQGAACSGVKNASVSLAESLETYFKAYDAFLSRGDSTAKDSCLLLLVRGIWESRHSSQWSSSLKLLDLLSTKNEEAIWELSYQLQIKWEEKFFAHLLKSRNDTSRFDQDKFRAAVFGLSIFQLFGATPEGVSVSGLRLWGLRFRDLLGLANFADKITKMSAPEFSGIPVAPMSVIDIAPPGRSSPQMRSVYEKKLVLSWGNELSFFGGYQLGMKLAGRLTRSRAVFSGVAAGMITATGFEAWSHRKMEDIEKTIRERFDLSAAKARVEKAQVELLNTPTKDRRAEFVALKSLLLRTLEHESLLMAPVLLLHQKYWEENQISSSLTVGNVLDPAGPGNLERAYASVFRGLSGQPRAILAETLEFITKNRPSLALKAKSVLEPRIEIYSRPSNMHE